MKSGIYKIINKDNGYFYLGSAMNIQKRFTRHLNDLKNDKHNNQYLQNVWNKHGESIFFLEIVEILENSSPKSLLKIEQMWLDHIFDEQKDTIYNISRLSSGGDNITNNPNKKQIVENIRNGLLERYRLESEEDKMRRRENLIGEKNPNWGNNWSIDQRILMSNQRKGIPSKIKGLSYEEIYGIEKSKELKKIISDRAKTNIGKKNPFYGKKHTKENLLFFSESQKGVRTETHLKKVKPFYIGEKKYLFLKDAADEYCVSYPSIIYRLKSKSEKYSEYKYIMDEVIIKELKDEFLKSITEIS